MKTRLLTRASVLALAVLLGACAGQKAPSSIRKVQMFHLKSVQPLDTKERMIQSETKKRMWGAISNTERRERLGNYYTVHWKTSDTATPVKVKIDYRQANTGSKVFSQEMDYPSPARSNKTEFTVTGEAYHTQGCVVSWRIQVIGEETSFLWD
jgi:hypothetical protein